jgi:hypothetical protein
MKYRYFRIKSRKGRYDDCLFKHKPNSQDVYTNMDNGNWDLCAGDLDAIVSECRSQKEVIEYISEEDVILELI